MKQLLENLIKEWRLRPLPTIYPRRIDLAEFTNLPVRKVVSVTGFRRSGKTFALYALAKKIGQNNTIYINFEDERLPRDTRVLTGLAEVITEIYGNKPHYLLMDEIQNIPGWSRWAGRIVETTRHQLFISGSSSKLASAQLPTELRGRSLTIHVLPLNFNEFCRFKNIVPAGLPLPQLTHYLREYLIFGGFPEIVLVEEGKKPLILDEYYKTFLSRDVIERHKLRNEPAINHLILLLLNSPYFTAGKLANNLAGIDHKISKASVMRYLNFLTESFFLTSIPLHTPGLKNRLKAERKPYFVDNYFLSRFSTQFSQNWGRLMENLVAGCLINREHGDIYYWKDYQNHEVDFVVRRQEITTELIQASFVSREAEIHPREIKSLIKAAAELNCQRAELISWDLDTVIPAGNGLKIICIPLYKWLAQTE